MSTVLLFLCSGCLISEQSGRLPEELAFHFDIGFNYAIAIGRAAALAIFARWMMTGWKNAFIPKLLGWATIAAAVVVLVSGLLTTAQYRVEVNKDRLLVQIPPQETREVPWSAIEGLDIEGLTWAFDPSRSMGAPPVRSGQPVYDLPEWQSMKVLLTDGSSFDVNLEPLSVEQRQTLWKGIAHHAGLVEQN